MEPITGLFNAVGNIAGAVLGGAGAGGIFAVVNLINGAKQREFQASENEKQRDFQKQM